MIFSMKTILFCNLPYAFAILKPLADELEKRNESYLWYVPKNHIEAFPYSTMPYTSNLEKAERFQSDVIFVPGNDVPYWLRGLKVQIFHGLAGEKKGHFRIRGYFDLYLTQGPYFTQKFQALAKKHKNFDVIETGWCKLDKLFTIHKETLERKIKLLKQYHAKKIVLYAPTFSPSLTSAKKLTDTIQSLAKQKEILVCIKFHDKMDKEIIKDYQNIDAPNLLILHDKDITPALQIADLMVSDTSSVVYEFILLDKPVITLESASEHINWLNLHEPDKIYEEVLNTLQGHDVYKSQRADTIAMYHPYNDGNSAKRMIEVTNEYIDQHGIPQKRKLSLMRKWKMKKSYNKKSRT